jgi:tetratricopeptide (TPR) repeat protein
MVLPASAPDAAPPAGAWLNRLSLILRLAERGVLVLVDRARPERLGDLARHVLREHPDAEVLTEAQGLASLPDGSTAILCVRAVDADWLNQERPVVQARALRVILFSDEETTVHLAQHAVDFYDWISHRIDCPEGPPLFAVRALRRAACARAPAVAWEGGDLEETFTQALPARTLKRVSAAQPYAALVEALKPRPKEWAVIVDFDIPLRARRSAWAAAEANRRGRLILDLMVTEPSALPRAHARALPIKEGERRLLEAGAKRPARLAAVLELEPDAIDAAARLARGGTPEAELSKVALQSDEPGAALARLLKGRGLHGATSERLGDEHGGPVTQTRFRLPDWQDRIKLALGSGDLEVAIHWAAGFRASTGGDARSSALLAGLLVMGSRLGEAREVLEDAKRRMVNNATEEARFEVMRAEGMTLLYEGRTTEAVRALSDALGAARRLGLSPGECNDIYGALVSTHLNEGRLKDAERIYEEWSARRQRAHDGQPFNVSWAKATAELLFAKRDARAASDALEPILKQLPAYDHISRTALERILAPALIQQERYHEAERLLSESIERYERLGLTVAPFRREHGRALFGLGRFREAEQELRRALQELPEGDSGVLTRLELARCLEAQGQLAEAEELLDGILPELRHGLAARDAQFTTALYEKARVRRLRGDVASATELLREALRVEQHTFGREHPRLLPILAEFGAALVEIGKLREAEPLLRRAVRLAEKIGDRQALALVLASLARAQAAHGFAHARDTAHRSLAAWDAAEVNPSPALRRELEAIAAGSSAPSRRPK